MLQFPKNPNTTVRNRQLFYSECGRYKLAHTERYRDDGERVEHRWFADHRSEKGWIQLDRCYSREAAIRVCREHAGDLLPEDDPIFQAGRESRRKGAFRICVLADERSCELWYAGFDSVDREVTP